MCFERKAVRRFGTFTLASRAPVVSNISLVFVLSVAQWEMLRVAIARTLEIVTVDHRKFVHVLHDKTVVDFATNVVTVNSFVLLLHLNVHVLWTTVRSQHMLTWEKVKKGGVDENRLVPSAVATLFKQVDCEGDRLTVYWSAKQRGRSFISAVIKKRNERASIRWYFDIYFYLYNNAKTLLNLETSTLPSAYESNKPNCCRETLSNARIDL